MDLFKLLGTIAIDNSEANHALNETGEAGEKAEGKLSKSFKAIGKGAVAVGKTIAVGMVAAGTAVAGLVTKSIASYADYEQLVGGVETLFKNSADKVMQYANNAYKTAGLSANEYMETVTSFSASLLQSLGGDTDKAAKVADMAITDMSDNANKMGTSMELIQNAYNGFAKGNFTMLDNLKLGYGGTKEEMQRLLKEAEKISGIKYDISSFADIAEAIHVIQTEMEISGISYEEAMARVASGELTMAEATELMGTTAKEAASTISGSIGMMKSAWSNLITGMSNENADFEGLVTNFVDSVSTVADNLMPRIEIALNGVVQLIDKLAPVIIGKIPELLTTLLPSVVNAATSLVQKFAEILPDAATALISTLPDLISGFETVFSTIISVIPSLLETVIGSLGELLPMAITSLGNLFAEICNQLPVLIKTIVSALPGLVKQITSALSSTVPILITGIVNLIVSIGQQLPDIVSALLDGIISLISALCEQLPVIIPQLISALVSVIELLGQQLPVIIPQVVDAIIQVVMLITQQLPVILPMLVEGLITLVNSLISQLPALIPVLCEALVSLLVLITEQLPVILPMLIQAVIDLTIGVVSAIIEHLPDILMALISALPDILLAVWDAIVMIFENLPAWFGQIFQGAVDLIGVIFSPIGDFFAGIWDGICNIFAPVGEFFSSMFSGAWNGIKTAWSAVTGWFSNIWTNIKSAFSSVKTWFKDIFKGAWDNIKGVFSGVKDFFLGIWDKIKSAFSAIGTKIGDAISGAVKSGINGVIGAAESVINGFLKMINNAISMINKIPGVNIKKVKLVEFTRLAKGGVVDEPTPALFGEDGAEAVVPLEKNQGWLRKVAENLHTFITDTANKNPSINDYAARSVTDKSVEAVRADVESTKAILDEILDRLDRFFPEALDAMGNPVPAVIGVEQAADALVNPINYRLGQIAMMKGRGR